MILCLGNFPMSFPRIKLICWRDFYSYLKIRINLFKIYLFKIYLFINLFKIYLKFIYLFKNKNKFLPHLATTYLYTSKTYLRS